MMGGITQKFYLKRDTWRIDFGGYAGRLNMDVDVKNTQGVFLKSVATSRKFRFFKLYVDRRVYKDLFFGLGVKGMKSWFEAQNNSNEALIETAFGSEGGYQWGGIARTFIDKRDNIFYPYKGMYLSYTFDYNAENDDFKAYSGNQYDIRYFKMLSSFRHILALHAYGKILSKSAPSNVLQFYGRAVNSTQRGFVTGEFYDRNIFSSDVEYRYILPVLNDKIGTAVFANFGKVYGNDNEFSDADWLVGGGVGLRYFILPYERIHAVLDAAWSKDTFAMYFGLRAPF
jgi:outer membrane protein assembly factor BamA